MQTQKATLKLFKDIRQKYLRKQQICLAKNYENKNKQLKQNAQSIYKTKKKKRIDVVWHKKKRQAGK